MAKGKFTLTETIEGSVSLVLLNPSLGGGLLTLNRGSKKIDAPGSRYNNLAPASQADLKRVYDNGAEFASMVTAPAGYVAPWQRKTGRPSLPAPASEEE